MKASSRRERIALQIAIAVAALVPVVAGASGVFAAPEFLDLTGSPSALTHLAYLNGLLLGIGIAFWSLIMTIERQGRTFRILAGIVVLGGLARAYLAARLGVWSLAVSLPLVMELGITPALCLWQWRIAKMV